MNAAQRERLKLVGKMEFVREEMTRLGFWPPTPEIAEQASAAEAELRVLYAELVARQTELTGIEAQIAEGGNIPALLAEVRRKRIERVRAERAVKRETLLKERAAKAEADKEWRRKALPFLGRDVSSGLIYEGGDAQKIAALGLPKLESASDIAAAIGVSETELAWLTYHRGAASLDHYSRFAIPKKRGGTRAISSPKPRLRVAQSWVLEKILTPLPVHDAATAFRPGVSILDNAARHAGRAVVVRLDFKDFFPSVTLATVKNLFRRLGYNSGVSSLLALLCTESPRVALTLDGVKKFVAVGARCLPQGACTSPALTNVLCRRLDARLTGAAASLGFSYTRYADDLTFSHAESGAPVGMLLTLARQIIEGENLTVNEEKTSVQRPQQRQIVTGLVVNGGEARISRRDLRNFRAFLHGCETRGFDEMSQRVGRDARAYASGYLAFVHMVSPAAAEKFRAAHAWLSRRAS